MTSVWEPDAEGWLRITPTTELRVRHGSTPLTPVPEWIPDRLVLNDPDVPLRPIKVRVQAGTPPTTDAADTLADVLTTEHTDGPPAAAHWFRVSDYGTYVQLRINDRPMELMCNRPDDGVELVEPGVSDGTRLVVEAREFGVTPA